MKLTVLYESKHTKIFVDFDETIGLAEVILPNREAPKQNPDLEQHMLTFGSGKYLVTMRHGWREFFHKLAKLPNDGIYMFSSGHGGWVFPQLQRIYSDDAVLSRVQVVGSLGENSVDKMAPFYRKHSILIDDSIAERAIADKLKRLKFSDVNVVIPSKFTKSVDNELSTVLGKVVERVAVLEKTTADPQLESRIRLVGVGI